MTDPILLDIPVIAKEWQSPDYPARLRDVLHPLKDATEGAPVLVEFTLYEDEPTTAHRKLHLGLSDGKGGFTYQPPHQVGDAELARAMLLAVTDPKLHAALETLRMHGLDIGAGSAFTITLTRDMLLAGPASQNETNHYLDNHKEFSSATLHNLAFLALPPGLSEHRKIEMIRDLDILLEGLSKELMKAADDHRTIAFSAERVFRREGAE